jgi:hypothetical protein
MAAAREYQKMWLDSSAGAAVVVLVEELPFWW